MGTWNMFDYIYDEETYPNFFSLTIRMVGCKSIKFEISERKNDLDKLVAFTFWLRDIGGRCVGFNNIGFDYPIWHYIMLNYSNGLTYEHIYQKAQGIIDTDWNDRYDNVIWDNDQIIPQLDLYKIHHFDNSARATSLKYLEFQMRMETIEDLPFPPGTWLTFAQMDIVLDYNDHDIDATEWFYNETLGMIRFREELTAKYNKSFMNASDKKIGSDFFIMKLEEALPGSCYFYDEYNQRQIRQTHHSVLNLKDAVFPYVRFEQPEFNRILNFFNSQTIYETKGVFKDLNCVIDGFEFVFGVGGIHGSIEAATVESDEEFALIDIDVASYYPNLSIANKLFPEHLSEQFCIIYKEVYDQRKSYKKGTPENQMLKLALNGVYGDSNSVYSPFFDSMYTMKITINGQLLLCMLAEQVMKIPNLKMIQINTDGLTVKIRRTHLKHLDAIQRWWEKLTSLELEEVEYSRMFIRDVNNYIAEPVEGKLKHKGAYQVDHPRDRKPLGWHQDTSAMVVSKAAEAALVRDADIREFITGHEDIFDFMCIAKVPRSSGLVAVDYDGNDNEIQRVTRYHVSLSGVELVKIMKPLPKVVKINPDAPNRRIGIAKGFKVTVCNDMKHTRRDLINFEWYVQETRKLVDRIKANVI